MIICKYYRVIFLNTSRGLFTWDLVSADLLQVSMALSHNVSMTNDLER